MLAPLLGARKGFLDRIWTDQYIGLCLTDDNAFFTGFTEADLTGSLNRHITIVGANGTDQVDGYLKSVGSGSGSFGSEAATNGDLELGATTGWSAAGNGAISVITADPTPYEGTYALKLTGTIAGGAQAKRGIGGHGDHFDRILWAAIADDSDLEICVDDGDNGIVVIASTTHRIADGWDNGETWWTWDDDNAYVLLRFTGGSIGTSRAGYIDGVSVKTMTAPASTGYRITTTPGGTVYRWNGYDSRHDVLRAPYTIALTF